MNVVVTGSRDWPKDHPLAITALLDGLWQDVTMGHLLVEMSEFHLFAGDCPTGVDSIVKWWAKQSPTHSYNEREDDPYFEFHEHKANWGLYGHAAGPIRNATMLKAAQLGLVVAFHTSRSHYLNLDRELAGKKGNSGTNDCASKARRMGGFRVYDVIGDFV